MTLIQWVNLEKEDAYAADADIGSKDRCGKISIKTLFEKDKVPLEYKVKITPSGSDNITYTTSELGPGRNIKFKMTKGTIDLGNEAEVSMSDEIQLPAAGGNKYKLVAKDANGKEVKSEEIEVKRKIYYQFMHMEDATAKVTPYTLTQLESHCKKNHVTLTKAGTDKKVPFHKCINSGAGGRFSHVGFAAEVNAQYDLSAAFKKVGCVTVLSNYIGTFKKVPVSIIHTLGGPTNPRCKISATSIELSVLTGLDFLWYQLDDDDDLAKRWFVRGAIKFTPPPAPPTPAAGAPVAPPAVAKTITIQASDLSIGGTKARTYGGHQIIKITPSADLTAILANPTGTVEFVLEINKVAGFSGGFSWGGGGFALTTCCTKAWFEDKPASKSDVIWNHEIGHRIGMVAFGNKSAISGHAKLPDGPSTLYGENRGVNDKGHQGPHCEKNMTYTASTNTWTGNPGCVLFGATASSTADSPLDYCAECTKIVRKLDLSFS
jgi:hypothetical protein